MPTWSRQRWLCYRTLWLRQTGQPHAAEAAMCKWWAPVVTSSAFATCSCIRSATAPRRSKADHRHASDRPRSARAAQARAQYVTRKQHQSASQPFLPPAGHKPAGYLILWPVPSYRLVPGNFQPDAGAALMGRHGTAIPGMLVACRHSRQIGAFLDVERQALRPLRLLGRGDRRRTTGPPSAFPVLISHGFSPSLGHPATRSRPIQSAAAMTAAPRRTLTAARSS
jgi:hypothetical protein